MKNNTKISNTNSTSLISSCGYFSPGSSASWPYVLTATTAAEGAASQGAQTYTNNEQPQQEDVYKYIV